MTKDQIKEILPHREPMLLIDEVELSDGIATAKYTVRGDEFFLQGHFPGNPVVPGVILCEMLAQSACVLIQGGGVPYFTGLDGVKFRGTVKPGDTLCIESELIKNKNNFYKIKAKGSVNDKLCVSGELTVALIKDISKGD